MPPPRAAAPIPAHLPDSAELARNVRHRAVRIGPERDAGRPIAGQVVLSLRLPFALIVAAGLWPVAQMTAGQGWDTNFSG